MKIIVHDVTITARTVEVSDKCPKCRHVLTRESAIEEQRLCSSLAYSHLDGSGGVEDVDALCSTDSADDNLDYVATTAVRCATCDAVIENGSVTHTVSK